MIFPRSYALTRAAHSIVFVVSVLVFAQATEAQQCSPPSPTSPLTDTNRTFIRKGEGQFNAPRNTGGTHTGADIRVRQSFPDKDAYAVRTVATGTVAYARVNGLPGKGFGNVIVVDHGNNCYSLYAHLASDPFTPLKPGGNLLKKVGDRVNAGDVLGYFVNVDADVDSTGNALGHPVAPHQVHFSLFTSPSGRTSTGALSDLMVASPNTSYVNPEPFLRGLGYSVE
jgi:murein DD-endopeptidase MepM/ murein hydrolase activator NlpD